MNIWFVLLVIAHVFLCLFLVMLVLIQNDKGGGLAGAFGGMGGSAAFTGSSTATFLTTMTGYIAGASFLVIILLNVVSMRSTQARQHESELKGARKGLSSVLPPMPRGGGIPG